MQSDFSELLQEEAVDHHGMAAAKEVSADDAIVVVWSEQDGIFNIQKQT